MARTVLVTGAAGGIGYATVLAFSHAGWKTFAADRSDPRDFPANVTFIQSDVSRQESVSKLFEQITNETDVLHGLVNNAAIQINKPIVEMSVEEWDATMASNFRAVFLTSKAAHPRMKAAKGAAIVNVSSVHAIATSIGVAAYAASKGAVMALSRAMAIEFSPDNIRVNAILPGAVDTEMLRSGLDRGHLDEGSVEDRLEDLARKTVIGRVGQPDEIARSILFLADGEQSGFITGEGLVVDGGATARLSTE